MDIRADLVFGRTGYDVTSYFRLTFIEVRETGENADDFGRILVARRLPAPPIGGHLVRQKVCFALM